MRNADLAKLLAQCRCRVIGWQDVRELGHCQVLGVLARAFDQSEAALLAEPSLAYRTRRPPDIVLIDPEVGVHVVEVKGITLEQVLVVEAGGVLRIRYRTPVARPHNVLKQARDAMFDIKDATGRAFGGDLRLRFEHWVAFPRITRNQWHDRFGRDAFCCHEFLFEDDLDPAALARRFGATDRSTNRPIRVLPLDQLQCVWRTFGDTSVTYWKPDERVERQCDTGTLGEAFDDAAAAAKRLTGEQQRLVEANWDEGPRLVRGVAGSGKTLVLAANCARRLVRGLRGDHGGLFTAGEAAPRQRVLAVCYNRTLAPFLQGKIEAAFRQRTGRDLPDGVLEVFAMNRLMHRLGGEDGLWRYRRVFEGGGQAERTRGYLEELRRAKADHPDRVAAVCYDAIYVDEGQDLLEEEYVLLRELCRVKPGGEPNLYVFYDDAQNLYGRGRPNWASLGLNVRGGRSAVMTRCHRNTRQVVDTALNVLYASAAEADKATPTREFFDLGYLKDRGLVATRDGLLRVGFAERAGRLPLFTFAPSARTEIDLVLARLAILLRDEGVRPEDVLVLTSSGRRADRVATAIERAALPGVLGVARPHQKAEKDLPLCRRGHITVSTVASAKGYDAFVTLLVSANEFSTDVRGRAMFYVGCTRAVEFLEVFAYEPADLAAETESVVGRLQAARPA